MTPAPGGRVFGRGRFRMASAIGLRHPASASCLGRHLRLAGRCPNNSSLFPPLAAVVVVALWTSSAERLFLFRNSGKSADFPELPFHGRGRGGKRQMQRRFLRKRGAAGKALLICALIRRYTPPSPDRGKASVVAIKFPAKVQSFRACPLPRGELSRSD